MPRHWPCEPGLSSDQPLCCSGYHEPGRRGAGGCSSRAQAAPALSGLDLGPSSWALCLTSDRVGGGGASECNDSKVPLLECKGLSAFSDLDCGAGPEQILLLYPFSLYESS